MGVCGGGGLRWSCSAHEWHHQGGDDETDCDQQESSCVCEDLSFPVGQGPQFSQCRRVTVGCGCRVQQVGGGWVGGCQVLRQPQEVQVGSVIQDGAAGSDSDCASQITHEVEEAGGQLQSFGRQAAQSQCDRGRNCELLGKAAQRLW